MIGLIFLASCVLYTIVMLVVISLLYAQGEREDRREVLES